MTPQADYAATEQFSELLRGLELSPALGSARPNQLFAIGQAIAAQAKRCAAAESEVAKLRADAERWRAMRLRYVGWTTIGCWLKFSMGNLFVTDKTGPEEADRLADAAIQERP